ncbi:MAG TPA: BatA domain-containing protein, partial [bacterium]|nr:BatA domain-containing protein [bacterium]
MFSFLNAFLLYGLVLASIPILIHLLNRKKARVVPFSSNRFLKALQKKQIKKLRWQQLLLLIIRAMIVACLVIAF